MKDPLLQALKALARGNAPAGTEGADATARKAEKRIKELNACILELVPEWHAKQALTPEAFEAIGYGRDEKAEG